MRITKFGHSCLLVEEQDARILIDPGVWSVVPDTLPRIDAIIITHEHHDHFFPENLKKVLLTNPEVEIYTNKSVAEQAATHTIQTKVLTHKQEILVRGVKVSGWGEWHASIYETLPVVRNIGFFIADRLFYPGDILNVPDKPVEILAYPVIAPWMKISETLDYGTAVKPKVAFPVHDGFLKFGGPYYSLADKNFTSLGVQWKVLEEGKPEEF